MTTGKFITSCIKTTITIHILMINHLIPCAIGGGMKVSDTPEEDFSLPPFKLKSGIKRVKEIGQNVSMFCNIPDHIPLEMKTCEWISPDLSKYEVTGNSILVGKEREDIYKYPILDDSIMATQDSKNCNITIKEIQGSQLGKWLCKIRFKTPSLDNNDDLEHYPHQHFLSTTLTAKKEIRVKDVRLPDHMIPISYRVHLTPFLKEGNFTIKGRVEIKVKLLKSSNLSNDARSVTLHIQDITILADSVLLVDKKQIRNTVVGHGYDSDRQFYTAHFRNVIKNDFTISMDFIGKLNNGMAGFYRSTYKDVNTGETKYIATTQMEPTDARRALPCFDEPNMKAIFQINLGRTRNMSSISNMPQRVEGKPMELDNEYVWDKYEPTLKMSTYLLAFVVSDFKFLVGNKTANNVTFRIWSRESAIEQTRYATSIGPRVLEYYEDYFNIKYPLPKQDMIAIPDFSAGAMENWGLITYRETALLYEPGVSSLMNKHYVALVIAHELAHQWFGDLVTMNWWTE